jgi:diguanylate cyclase (GGDEF)-like protein
MSRVSFNRKRVKLKQLLGIRARLAVLALIVVAPLMLERARSLEDTRTRQIAQAAAELADLAQHSADAEREVISSVETILKSAAYIRSSVGGVSRSCDLLRASLPVNLPWIQSLMIVGGDSRVQCSTLNVLVGVDMSNRPVLRQARQTRDFAFSDFQLARSNNQPIIIAAYPVSAISDGAESLIVAGINLDWMSRIMINLGGRPGIAAALVDSAGVVLAAPPDRASTIGHPLEAVPQLAAIADQAAAPGQPHAPLSIETADGAKRSVSFMDIPGTQARLVVSIDEARVSASINRDIQTAYLQLGFVCLFVLLGAVVAAEKMVIRPIGMMAAMAKRFGQGDWSARAACKSLPAEFIPLARAFNAMATQLGQRERELVANNDRLTEIASIDMLTGLANRRGFQGRIDFEWMKACQQQTELSLLMIDVDHFKLYNDTYGHPEGDACLARIGQTLAGMAAESKGFAGRYGGEEFCLLLPDTTSGQAREIGEAVRTEVERLAMPHTASGYRSVTVSIGVAGTQPNQPQKPSELIEAADAALYAAKHRGRNTVVEHGFVRAADRVRLVS